jgi:hypothetical protein
MGSTIAMQVWLNSSCMYHLWCTTPFFLLAINSQQAILKISKCYHQVPFEIFNSQNPPKCKQMIQIFIKWFQFIQIWLNLPVDHHHQYGDIRNLTKTHCRYISLVTQFVLYKILMAYFHWLEAQLLRSWLLHNFPIE